MTEYHPFGVNLSALQAKKIVDAHKKNKGVSLRLSKNDLHGNYMLPLTQTQVNKIQKAKGGVDLHLSAAQLKYMEKTGGFLPLLTLIPLIAGAVSAVGGLSGGIASAVSAAKSNQEQVRHNKAIEEQLKGGAGIISDTVAKIPKVGNFLSTVLKKIGLGIPDHNRICNGECIRHKNCMIKKIGRGLFIEPAEIGEGLFLGPWKD